MMQPYIAMGIFALIVALISLTRVMADQEFHRITSMKRAWGRRRGLALHFIGSIALPLVVGVVFFSGGLSGLKLVEPLIAEHPFSRSLAPNDVDSHPHGPHLADTYTNMA